MREGGVSLWVREEREKEERRRRESLAQYVLVRVVA